MVSITKVNAELSQLIKDKKARTLVLALEFFEFVNGRIASENIREFKNIADFKAFVDEEIEHADSVTYDPHSFNGVKTIYIVQGSEEKLREIKKNCNSHADMEKYVNTQTSEFSITVIKIKPKEV